MLPRVVCAQSIPIPAPIQSLDVRVTAEFNKQNSTLTDIPMSGTVTLQAGATYSFEFTGFYSAIQPAGGIQLAVGGTATATNIRYSCASALNDATIATNPAAIATALGTSVCSRADAGGGALILAGLYTVNAGGTFTIQFAQNTTNAGANANCAAGNGACIFTGSYLRIRQVP